MKKLCLVAGILSFSMIGFAQKKTTTKAQDNDTIIKVITTPEKRTSNAETELVNLKTSQVQMRKHFSETPTNPPFINTKKKIVVNRVGSKQLNRVKE